MAYLVWCLWRLLPGLLLPLGAVATIAGASKETKKTMKTALNTGYAGCAGSWYMDTTLR